MNGPHLLVATAGGHVDELYELADRFSSRGRRVWVTSRSAQTESLLADEDVRWVAPVGARQLGRALVSLPEALRIVRRTGPAAVISTGAALAAPFLVAARLLRVPTRYIESATRLAGPSLTGRLAERLPGVDLAHQGTWHRRRWDMIPPLFERYQPGPADRIPNGPIRVVVSFGSERFPFSRAIDTVVAALPPGAEVFWQLGHTPPPPGLTGDVRDWVAYRDLAASVAAADVVVTHAGVGSVLTALRSGRVPVIVPRSAARGEHVDEHQSQLAAELARRSLAIVLDDDPTRGRADLLRASRLTAVAQ